MKKVQKMIKEFGLSLSFQVMIISLLSMLPLTVLGADPMSEIQTKVTDTGKGAFSIVKVAVIVVLGVTGVVIIGKLIVSGIAKINERDGSGWKDIGLAVLVAVLAGVAILLINAFIDGLTGTAIKDLGI